MVILDCRSNMLGSSSGNQYLNPDYLAPLPSEMDAKSSPLAMLAKTCSLIGADATHIHQGNNSSNSSKQSPPTSQPKHRKSSEAKDNNNIGSPNNNAKSKSPDDSNGGSRSSSAEIRVTDNPPRLLSSSESSSLSPASTVSAQQKRPSTSSPNNNNRRNSNTPSNSTSDNNTPRPKTSPESKAPTNPSPTIRSGLEILAGHPRDIPLGTYRTSAYPAGGFGDMSRLAAFQASLFSSNPFLAAAVGLSPPPTSQAGGMMSGSSSNPCRDPLCRDPMCPTTSMRSQQLLAAASGAFGSMGASHYASMVQREVMMQAQMAAASSAAASAAASAVASAASGGGLPYVCNWVAGAEYCGRRFASSEDLLVHLKTHTNLSSSDPRSLSNLLSSSSAASMHPHRFHPYTRPPGLPAGLASPSLSLGLSPHGFHHLNPYAALYPALFARPPML